MLGTDWKQQLTEKWTRSILKSYWILIGLYTVLTFLYGTFLSSMPRPQFYMTIILVPVMVLCAVTLAGEILFRLTSSRNGYLYAIMGQLNAITIVWANPNINAISTLFVMPIMLSIFYGSRKLIAFSSFTGIALYYITVLFNKQYAINETLVDRIGMTTLLAGCMIIASGLMAFGLYVFATLEETIRSRNAMQEEKQVAEAMSRRDALTGLNNHLRFQEQFAREIAAADSFGAPLHLAIIDIDGFKTINDTYGHQTGDVILSRIADTIRSEVGDMHFVARYGGEEFCLLIRGLETFGALRLVESMRAVIAKVRHKELEEKAVTVSIGLERYNDDSSRGKLFESADHALYQAKRTGKNKTVLGPAALLRMP